MSDLLGGSSGILAAHQPLVVPMLLRLSQFRLNSYVVLVLSKQKGCTLVFKTDPLQNVEVSSTFDSIAVIQSFIQREIEEQLREMFREDLPSIIHRLSQRWVAGQTRVEAPYLRASVPAPLPRIKSTPATSARKGSRGVPSVTSSRRGQGHEDEPLSAAGMLPGSGIGLQPGLHPHRAFGRPESSPSLFRSRSSAPASTAPPSSFNPPSDRASARSGSKTPLSSDFPTNPNSSLPDIENFDPTYGLRPEGPPTKGSYSGLGRLFEASRGLRELTEDQLHPLHGDSVVDIDEESAYDVVDWDENQPIPSDDVDDVEDDINNQEFVEMETIPAVGGGFITRPRIYQSQSSIGPPPMSAPVISPNQGRKTGHPYREKNAPRFTRTHSEDYDGSRPPQLGRTAIPAHRDRGIGMDTVTDGSGGVPSYNPYFGDIYRSRSPGRSILNNNDEIGEENGGTSSQFNTISRGTTAPTSRSIPIGSPSSPLRRPSADRSISRSPPATGGSGDFFHYGSPSQHQRHFPGTSPNEDEFGGRLESNFVEYNGLNSSRGIILRNQSVSQLSALSRSNQTLSPYTRSFSHFTVRSGPPKPFISNTTPLTSTTKAGPKKARRKRIHRLGGGANGGGGNPAKVRNAGHYDGRGYDEDIEKGGDGNHGADLSYGRLSHSPPPPSEFSDEDVEHYFRTRRPSEAAHSPLRDDGFAATATPGLGIPSTGGGGLSFPETELRRRTTRQRAGSQSVT